MTFSDLVETVKDLSIDEKAAIPNSDFDNGVGRAGE